MTDNKKYHIFISYSRKNSDYKDRLVTDLKEYGFEVWVDTSGIELTHNWTDSIKDGITNSKILIYLGSKEAVKSTYVSYELGYAEALDKIILPIQIKGTSWGECVPSWYHQTQGQELRGKHQYELRKAKFFDRISKLIIDQIMHYLISRDLVSEHAKLKNILRAVHNVGAEETIEYSDNIRRSLEGAGAIKTSKQDLDEIVDVLLDWELLNFHKTYVNQPDVNDFFNSLLTKLGQRIANVR